MKHTSYMCHGEPVTIPTPESYADCFTLIRSDMFRLGIERVGTLKLLMKISTPPLCNYLTYWRLCQYKPRGLKRLLALWPNLMLRVFRLLHNIDIPASTRIGYGFYIGHGMCMVVNGGTVIGNNVNVSQFLNIGTNHDRPAVIGNGVYIGPMVSIVEDVNIGSGVNIGAGAVVTKDIEPHSTAAGVPARIVNRTPHNYIGHPYPVPCQ